VLLRHVLRIGRVGLYLRLNEELTPDSSNLLAQLLERRLNGEPAAYITGSKEFFGLSFEVSPAVLIPRPETELLVEKAIELAETLFQGQCLVADVGTGCGAIAVILAAKLPEARIYATDISPSALEVAADNCRTHGFSDRVTLLRGDLLDPLPEPVHIIVANMPYVTAQALNDLPAEICRFEPIVALNGDSDGLDTIRRLVTQAGERLLPGGVVLLEIGHDQGRAVCALARERFPQADVAVTKDLRGLDRVVSIVTA